MISWETLVGYIEKLQELPNGSGTEIEFSYNGKDYGICSYRDSCDLQDCGESGCKLDVCYTYSTLSELGKARDMGFSVEESWNSFTNVVISPDFDEEPFEEIYAAYEKACRKRRRG